MSSKHSRAFLAGLSRPAIPTSQVDTVNVNWFAKFTQQIEKNDNLSRLEMIQRWISRTTNLSEADRATLLFNVAVRIYTLPQK